MDFLYKKPMSACGYIEALLLAYFSFFFLYYSNEVQNQSFFIATKIKLVFAFEYWLPEAWNISLSKKNSLKDDVSVVKAKEVNISYKK